MHKETMARYTEEMKQQEVARLEKTAKKEAALNARMEAEKKERMALNAKKADEAAAKIDRAAASRRAMNIEQRKIFHERHLAQEARMASMADEEERKRAEAKLRASQKGQHIKKAQEVQSRLQEERKAAIMAKEAAKQAELDRKAVQIEDARYEKQQQRLLMHAASRGRVDSSMNETKAKMEHLGQELSERFAQVEEQERQKAAHINSAHQMAVRVGLQKQSMHFSMGRMRLQVCKKQVPLRLEVPAHIRANVQNEKLKGLLDRADSKGDGQISMMKLREVLAQEAKLDEKKPKRGMRHAASAPALESEKTLTEEEKLLKAFRDADADNSGSISKREMFKLLKELGIDETSSKMSIFRGFDVDDDGIISFEEFKKIAAAL